MKNTDLKTSKIFTYAFVASFSLLVIGIIISNKGELLHGGIIPWILLSFIYFILSILILKLITKYPIIIEIITGVILVVVGFCEIIDMLVILLFKSY